MLTNVALEDNGDDYVENWLTMKPPPMGGELPRLNWGQKKSKAVRI